MSRGVVLFGLTLLLASPMSGCFGVHDAADGVVLTYSTWVRVSLIVVPILGIVVCLLFCLLKPRWIGATLAAGVAVLTALFIPGILLDRVVMTPERVEERRGLWWSQTATGFDLDEVDYVVVTRKRINDRNEIFWRLHGLGGTTREFAPGDVWAFNSDVVADYIEDHGILVRFE